MIHYINLLCTLLMPMQNVLSVEKFQSGGTQTPEPKTAVSHSIFEDIFTKVFRTPDLESTETVRIAKKVA